MDTKLLEKKMENISPFELKNRLIDMADESLKKTARTMLNAGRGNPNWIATTPREAFFLLGKFGLEECRHVMFLPEGIAGIPEKQGIAARFEQFLKSNTYQPGAKLLEQTYHYMLMQHAVDPDSLVHEWAESVIGNQYPVPDRILQFTEMLVCDYLNQEMCDNRPPRGAFNLFATEGGTAAMCYIFDSLQENFLLDKGDGIALMVPAFTPYIEIPQLDRYRFKVTELHANRMSKDGLHLWQYSDEDIDRLKNPAIKALFVTNPSNPPSYTLSPETMARIVNIVKEDNPNLMIITDDVYGTFSPHFRSFMAEIPYNTLCVYSFSKYFGATGWRNAVIALHEYNVFDRQISRLPKGEARSPQPPLCHADPASRKIEVHRPHGSGQPSDSLESYGRTFIASTDADELIRRLCPAGQREQLQAEDAGNYPAPLAGSLGQYRVYVSGRPLTGRLLYGNRHAGLGRKVLWREVCGIPQKNVQSAERSIPPCSGNIFSASERWRLRRTRMERTCFPCQFERE